MVMATIRIRPAQKQRSEALGILRSVQGLVLGQKGCLACRLFEEVGNNPSILFCAHWDSDDSLHHHICSELYRRILMVIELSARAPEVAFHEVTQTRGLDLVEHLRCRDASPGECRPAPKKP